MASAGSHIDHLGNDTQALAKIADAAAHNSKLCGRAGLLHAFTLIIASLRR